MIYDYLIIGAGIGGLSSGLNLAKNKKKVLILEKNNMPGGLATTFKRGRFEFDTGAYELNGYGTSENPGKMQQILKNWNINLDVKPIDYDICLATPKTTWEFKGKFEELILELSKMHQDSLKSLEEFIKITKEINEAVSKIAKNAEILESDYPNFYKYLDKNAEQALQDLKMPKEVINYFGYIWVEIGSPLTKLSFIDFSIYMYNIIFKKKYVLSHKVLDFILKLDKTYQENGGKILCNSEVVEVKKENNYYLVTTSDKLEYKSKEIIFDVSMHYALKDLIKEENKDLNKRENARTIGANALVVYLGLNRSAKDIGLKHHKYYHYDDLNSENCFYKMQNLNHHTYEGIVLNNANEFASPKNTTILVLIKTFYDDAWKNINGDFAKLKMELASNLIEEFETDFNVDISEYIEEMEIASPETFIRHTNTCNGSIFGYMPKGYDNNIHRLLCHNLEKQKHLTFVGAYSLFGYGLNNAFYSGYYLTNELLKEGVKNE